MKTSLVSQIITYKVDAISSNTNPYPQEYRSTSDTIVDNCL